MKNKDKFVDYFLEPYLKEAVLKLIIDIISIGLLTVIMAALNFPIRYFIYVFIGYGVLVYFLSYRIIIRLSIDKRRKDYVTEIVSVKDFDEEQSLTGGYQGFSYIHRFYPQNMDVTRYKVNVIDKQSKKKKLRSVMSYRRRHIFRVFRERNINYLKITYLKRSKIIIHVELPYLQMLVIIT